MTLKLNGTNSEAAPAYAGDDADTGLQCGTNELKLVTGGSARATVDSSGNFGIGTTTPTSNSSTNLHVSSSGSGTNAQVRVTGNNATGLDIIQGGDSTGYVWLRDNNNLLFGTNDTERMRILSDGTIRLASGCPGIDFSQIQTNNSGMTSETLDSYEEGTWTPYFTSEGVTNSFSSNLFTSYGNQNGRYTKVGRHVFLTAFIELSGTTYANGGADNQNLGIAGLPFPTDNSQTYPSISVGWFNNWAGWSESYTPMGYIETNSSHIRMTYAGSNGIGRIKSNHVQTTSSGILFSVHYCS